ncbi:hypothetical protein LCGC14_1024190 [marine sediment metagenome]|uniref:General secretion pathway GspH domain-containing protein n=1 Tax=marine sediment metagenome TaxID=412755 RepID=A0A0F9NI59_9ZZZZ
MKTKGITLIEMIVVLAIVMVLASLAGLIAKTVSDSSETICSGFLIEALLGMGKATAQKEGNYAGIYFYDQNEVLCAMEVIALRDYSVPYIPLNRLDGSQIREVGSRGDVNEAVVLFSPSGRLVIKDIMIAGYRNNSNRYLSVNGKDYYINSYTGNLIDN